MCTIIIVKCSWDGLLEGRNCSCVWPFWCSELCSVDQTVTVQRGSVLIWGVQSDFASHFTYSVLYEYSSWRVGKVVPMIRSALRSLIWSDLVAEPNQIDIDVQRMESMMAEWNFFSSSCGRLNFLSRWRKYSLCWAFFTMESMWLSHFWSWEMVAPRNLNDSTVVTVLFMMVSGARAGRFLLKWRGIISIINAVWSISRLRTRAITFHVYMLPLGNIIRKHRVSFYCYADDTQLYISLRPGETHQIEKLMECIVDIQKWMTSNFLLLNKKKLRC